MEAFSLEQVNQRTILSNSATPIDGPLYPDPLADHKVYPLSPDDMINDGFSESLREDVMKNMMFKRVEGCKWWHPAIAQLEEYILFDPATDSLAQLIGKVFQKGYNYGIECAEAEKYPMK